MNWQTFVRDYLSFSKKERTGIIVLVLIIMVVALLPFIRRTTSSEKIKPSPADTSWLAAADRLQKSLPQNDSRQTVNENRGSALTYHRAQKPEVVSHKEPLFYFDPNTLDADGFKRLGLRDKTIRILMNYRNKGGRFRNPKDLKKIYTLQPDEYERLDSYIRIVAHKEVYTSFHNNAPRAEAIEVSSAPRFKGPPIMIDINTADTSAFQSLYGIGSKRAFRIVHFRDKLGGFYSIDQVGETYGVPDSVFKKIKRFLTLSSPDLRKININEAGYEELNNHPYISSRLAFLIVKQRKERGSFSNIEAIKEVIVQTSDSYDKVSKYITVE